MVIVLVIAIIIALGVFSFIVYLALSKKSVPLIKKAAIIALIIIGISIIVSLYIIFSKPVVEVVTVVLPVIEPIPQEEEPVRNNSLVVLLMGIFFLLFIALIIYIALHEQRKEKEKMALSTGDNDDKKKNRLVQ